MEKTKTDRSRIARFKTKEPSLYHVIMHNDDETTMDFVVMVLQRIFRKTAEDAEVIMMKIHTDGAAVVGTYSKDIATSKANYTETLARQEGFPLKLTVEEV